jgi:hypothetical protein
MSPRAIKRELRHRGTPRGRRDQLERELDYRLHFRAPWMFPRMAVHMLTDSEVERELRDPRTSVERRQKLLADLRDRRVIREGLAPDRI